MRCRSRDGLLNDGRRRQLAGIESGVARPGKHDGEAGSARITLEEYDAPMGLDRAVDDGQSEAAPVGFGCEEWIEDAITNFGRDRGAVVGHTERHCVALERETGR